MISDTEQWEHDEQRAMEIEINSLREKNQNLFNALMVATGKNDELYKTIKEQEGYDGIAHNMERLHFGLENCRLLAARHRKESWALLILGFCAEAGVVGSVTRSAESERIAPCDCDPHREHCPNCAPYLHKG